MTRALASRRLVCGGLLGCCLPAARAHAAGLLCCGFSPAAGWSDNARLLAASRPAGGGDRSGIRQVVERVTEALALRTPLEVRLIENTDNAFAVFDGNRRYVVIDVDFLERLNSQVRTRWAAILVVAHEVGHHYAGWTRLGHRTEINADYWAGQALQRLGAARETAARGMFLLGGEADTAGHPNRHVRMQCVRQGWDDAAAGRRDPRFCESCS